MVFLSALVQGLGLSLGSREGEAQAVEGLLVRIEGWGVDWVLTGETAYRCTGSARPDRESAYALTSLLAPAGELYALWRGRWEVENRLHHKQDAVLGEDASRSWKGAAGLMYL